MGFRIAITAVELPTAMTLLYAFSSTYVVSSLVTRLCDPRLPLRLLEELSSSTKDFFSSSYEATLSDVIALSSSLA